MAEKDPWLPRPDVEAVIRDAISKWHPELHRQGATIIAVSRPEASSKGGKQVWASIKKASDLERVLHDPQDDTGLDFIMIVAADVWRAITEKQRLALVDHELNHVGWEVDDKGEGRWAVRAHDIEEFTAVVERHGNWKEDVRAFLDAALKSRLTQPELFGGLGADVAETLKGVTVETTEQGVRLSKT